MRKIYLVVFCAALFFCENALAQSFSEAMAKSVSQISEGADVAGMGGANTALTSDYTIRNPGAADVSDAQSRSRVGILATYENVNFKKGPDINLYIVSAAFRFPVGTLQISYSDGSSNVANLDEFNTLKFDKFTSIDAQYGLKLGEDLLCRNDELYAGVGYAYSESKVSGQFILPVPGTTLVFNSVSESVGNTLESGILYRIAKKVNLGVMYLHSWDSSDDSLDGFTQTTNSQTDQLRLGVSAKITPLTLVAFDYRHIYLPNGEDDDQYFAGIEQYLIKDRLALYGGWANGGVTTGVGIYTPYGGINVGYMHRTLRATEEFLGKADVLAVSIFGAF